LYPNQQHLQSVTALIDRYKLGQVLRNLVSNALKFSSKSNGRVQVSAEILNDVVVDGPEETAKSRRVELVHMKSMQMRRRKNSRDATDRKVTVQIKVTDNGAGISKGNQAQLFSPGAQFNSGELQQGKGSGFGLWSKFI
jgi:signal transduction histidine kinase